MLTVYKTTFLKFRAAVAPSLFMLLAVVYCSGQEVRDQRVETIDHLLEQTNIAIGIAEKEAPYTDIFVVEVAVNKAGTSYPAVGIFSNIAKFYYTYGDRETDPYPDQLIKIEITTKRSALITTAEFLFNEGGQLVYGKVHSEGLEQRETVMHFDRERLIKMSDDGKEVNPRQRSVIETGAAFKRESARMVALFKSAIKEGF